MPQINPPPVSPRLCHRTSGASIALRGGRGPGDESARPLCSRHFRGLIPRHRYQAAWKWKHGHQGEDGQSAPPGLLGAETGALPWTRAADGARSLRGVR